jgi:hypothetical protein
LRFTTLTDATAVLASGGILFRIPVEEEKPADFEASTYIRTPTSAKSAHRNSSGFKD